jgi:hypothetical protein
VAEIDLKNADVFIEDGYSRAGAVNLMAGYVIGTTTMAVDSFGAGVAVAVGDRFQLTGDVTIYTITAHTETSLTTTSITFTPGLVIAATDNEVITVLPHSLEVHIGEGSLTFEEKTPRTYRRNKGRLFTVKNGDEEPVDVSITAVWEFLKSDPTATEPLTPREVLYGIDAASTWVTTSSDPCEPYAVNIRVRYTPPCTTAKKEDITFRDFRVETLGGSVKDGQLDVKGKSNRTRAVVSRVA